MKLQYTNTTILTFVIALVAVFVNASTIVSEQTTDAPPMNEVDASGEGVASSAAHIADITQTPEGSAKKKSVIHFFQKKVLGRIAGTYPPATPQNSKESYDSNTETIAAEVVKHESVSEESA